MALSNNELLGKWLGYSITARIFTLTSGTKIFATQSTQDGGFVVRGRGILQNADFVKESTLDDTEIASVEASDAYGTSQPLSFETPTGYVKTVKNGTTVYYPQALVDSNPTIVEDTTGTTTGTTTAVQSAQTFLQSAWAWIQANPLQSVVLAFVAYLVYDAATAKKGKKSLLSKIF